MMRQSHRVIENLHHIRETVVNQQTPLSEHRARITRGGRLEDEYNDLPDEYKRGGLANGHAKNRRGEWVNTSYHDQLLISLQSAEPSVRCHGCNRTETPEWRRGPDGARTLCTACGLHYAKLMRKDLCSDRTGFSAAGFDLRPSLF